MTDPKKFEREVKNCSREFEKSETSLRQNPSQHRRDDKTAAGTVAGDRDATRGMRSYLPESKPSGVGCGNSDR